MRSVKGGDYIAMPNNNAVCANIVSHATNDALFAKALARLKCPVPFSEAICPPTVDWRLNIHVRWPISQGDQEFDEITIHIQVADKLRRDINRK
jgi:hypothetical protein